MRRPNRRTWWCCAGVLLAGCLEPNPNAVGLDEAGTSDTGTSEAGTTEAGTSEAGTTTDTTDTTTGSPACVDIVDADECAATTGCQPVDGSRLKKNGPGSPCLEPLEFLGCIPMQGCDDALTWFCQGNDAYQVPDSCGPAGFDPCDGPADPVDACP